MGLVHPEVVGPGTRQVEGSNLGGVGQVGDVDDVNVSAGSGAELSRPLLTQEQVLLLAVRGVPEPPGVMDLGTGTDAVLTGDHAPHQDWIRGAAALHPVADVVDQDARVPDTDDGDAVPDERVVHAVVRSNRDGRREGDASPTGWRADAVSGVTRQSE